MNLALGEAEESLIFFENLEGTSPIIRHRPDLSRCGALTFRDTGHEARAIEVLEAIFAESTPPTMAICAIDLAGIHAEARRYDDARRWLSKIPENGRSKSIDRKAQRMRMGIRLQETKAPRPDR